ncbi:ECF-type sigma factor [uncultured Paludibaculum sp.]|uniref:ECF-type sigma factor n=1 Tax=uncultured Paludibaculum sp. TaxID=1765020 RepID=UPI002AAB6F91|nr:ECF-type sigma factor [uncultured Paludibaculum sp.]
MSATTITNSLEDWWRGDPRALSHVVSELYPQLRRAASNCLCREARNHTLQSTALVHEAFLQLSAGHPVRCEARTHFLGIATRVMRQILIQYARRRGAAKRGGGSRSTRLDEGSVMPAGRTHVEDALEEALERLRRVEPRRHLVVEMRYRFGSTVPEIAGLTNLSVRTVERELQLGRTWLEEAVFGKDGAWRHQ